MEPWPPTSVLVRRLYGVGEPAEAVAWDLPSFLKAYTLHDSGLFEVRLGPGSGILVLVDWDMYWNRRVPPEYHNLVIGIPVVYSAAWSQGSWMQATLSGATSELVTEAERKRMFEEGSVDLRPYQGAKDEISPPFEDESLRRTTFDLINWSRLTILHGSLVKLLCLDDDGRAGVLPCGDALGGP